MKAVYGVLFFAGCCACLPAGHAEQSQAERPQAERPQTERPQTERPQTERRQTERRQTERRRISFNEDIRPILSNYCWSCHGPDEDSRQSGLRLDKFEAATEAAESGVPAIVPGTPDTSPLIARIFSHDADVVMPPPGIKKTLSAQQKQLLAEWIRQGAEFAPHWAFQPPRKAPLPEPEVADSLWPRNPIDRFIVSRLRQSGLSPAAEAAPEIWLRRVHLDLTGLPPTVPEQEQFALELLHTDREAGFSHVVDRLMNSPRFAERMAMHWLDGARYADTNGYNNDEVRTLWPWRDWVIEAFARNLPWDQFVIQQLAGDLLPDATLGQKVASGFNRNHVLTTEGGIIEEEYHHEYVADRVHTTATVFMAMSMQCARCHDHKYDPISQREYYQFAAFFNNVPDRIVSYSSGRMAEPLLKVPSPAQQQALTDLDALDISLRKQLQQRESDVETDLSAWEESLTEAQILKLKPVGLVTQFSFEETEGDTVTDQVDEQHSGTIKGPVQRLPGKEGNALAFDGSTWVESATAGQFDSDDSLTLAAWVFIQTASAGTILSRMDDARAYQGYDVQIEDGRITCHLIHRWPQDAFKVRTKEPIRLGEWQHVALTYDGSRRAGGLKIHVNGSVQPVEVVVDQPLSGSIRTGKPFHIGRRQASVPFHGRLDEVQLFSVALSNERVSELAAGRKNAGVAELLRTRSADRSQQQRQRLTQYYLNHIDVPARDLRAQLAALPQRRRHIEEAIPVTMIMAEMPEIRTAFVLNRGQYDQAGESVVPGFPAVLSHTQHDSRHRSDATSGTPELLNRLHLARWLADPQHPLTARVAVNRWWEMIFGTGLVETSEDFGVQGAMPSHPELLDWLACELTEQQWNVRWILKQMVLSATYRQSSAVTALLLETDPGNRLLARGPRFRLPAEMIRDNMLAVSGLLQEQTGGPSVRPWQPEGLWEDVSVERRDKYVPDKGDGQYRRSMYTFWKRTCPPPSMAAFDAPDRETCVIRRARTNTPLQALVLLNDPVGIEAASALANGLIEACADESQRAELAFRSVVARRPGADEANELRSVVATAREHYRAHPEAVSQLNQTAVSQQLPSTADIEQAAWTIAVSVLMNTDEAISKP